MLDSLLVAELAPFTVALGIMLLIALTEAMGTVFGLSAASMVDQLIPDIDADIGAGANVGVDVGIDGGVDGNAGSEPQGVLSRLFSWLNVGRVPVLVLFVAFLTIFGMGGILLQGLFASIVGVHMPISMAVVATLFVSLPPTRWLGLGLSRIMPKDESDAVSTASFVGKIATITNGVARHKTPTQAKLKDEHGQTHYVLVEPDDADGEFSQGAEVLLLKQVSPSHFTGLKNENELLSDR